MERDYLKVDYEGTLFDKRQSDIEYVKELPESFDGIGQYVSLMRAAILYDWNKQKELKKSIIMKNLCLDFIKNAPFSNERELNNIWTV